jgi:choline transport protein
MLTRVDAFCYAIALSYVITDIDALLSGIDGYPLSAIYSQATGSAGGTFGLLFIIFVSSWMCCVGTILTASK